VTIKLITQHDCKKSNLDWTILGSVFLHESSAAENSAETHDRISSRDGIAALMITGFFLAIDGTVLTTAVFTT